MNNGRLKFVGLALFVASSLAYATTHFSPVQPTGLPYHIIISSITVNGAPVLAGTEIGVFDENLCVGSFTVESQGQTNLDIVAWQGNPSYGLTGFTTGHSITFKIWVELYGAWLLLDAAATFSAGDGYFGSGSYSVAALTATSSELPAISIAPTSLDFGTVTVNQSSTKTFTISNTGTARLTISGISSNDNRFSLGNYPAYLTPGQSAKVTVTFTPNVAVLTTATITINSDDPLNPQKTINVIGQGIPTQQALIQISPASLEFGFVPIGKTVRQNIWIQNAGNQPLILNNVFSNKANFIPFPTTTTIDAGASCLLPVEFTPTAPGTVNGTLTINSNAGNNPNLNIGMSGVGYSAHFVPIAETGLPYTIVINSLTVDNHDLQTGDQVAVFDGELCVGTVVYTGSYPLQLIAWQGDASQNLPGFTVGHSMTFKLWSTTYGQHVELTPSVIYTQGNGKFGAGEFSVVDLTANSGLQPIINIYDNELNFPPVQVGNQTSLTLTIKNTGISLLTVSDIRTGNSAFRVSPTNFTLVSQASRQITVTFQPADALPYSTDLVIYSDDPNRPTVTIKITGQGLPTTTKQLLVSTTALQFEPTVIGQSSTISITLFNNSSGSINVTNIYCSDIQFIPDETALVIQPGKSHNLTVKFRPVDVGKVTGTLTIVNDSQDNPQINITLNGLGYKGYFKPVTSTGLPYTIIIDSLITEGVFQPATGDEIGIFDQDLCVGVIVVESNVSKLSGVAWEENSNSGSPGFKKNNPIILKYFIHQEDRAISFKCGYQIKEGNGSFGYLPYTVLSPLLAIYYPPDPPRNFRVIDSVQVIQLMWDANGEPDLDHYRIYRSSTPDFIPDESNMLGIIRPPAVTYQDSLIENGVVYYYKITAVDTAGSISNPTPGLRVLSVYLDVWDVSFAQRKDGSAMVDVYYSFSGHFSTEYQVILYLSYDDGVTWTMLEHLSGASGAQMPGEAKHVVWNFGQEYPSTYFNSAILKITITDLNTKKLNPHQSEFFLDFRIGG